MVESGDCGFVGWGGVINVCDSFVGVDLFVVEMCVPIGLHLYHHAVVIE